MIQESTSHQIEAIFDGCKDVFDTGKTRSIEWRLAQLNAIDQMLSEQQESFKAALARDLGKPETESWLLEISFVQVACRYARKRLARL